MVKQGYKGVYFELREDLYRNLRLKAFNENIKLNALFENFIVKYLGNKK